MKKESFLIVVNFHKKNILVFKEIEVKDARKLRRFLILPYEPCLKWFKQGRKANYNRRVNPLICLTALFEVV